MNIQTIMSQKFSCEERCRANDCAIREIQAGYHNDHAYSTQNTPVLSETITQKPETDRAELTTSKSSTRIIQKQAQTTKKIFKCNFVAKPFVSTKLVNGIFYFTIKTNHGHVFYVRKNFLM